MPRLTAFDETNAREVKIWSLDGLGAADRHKVEQEALAWLARFAGDDVVLREVE